MSDFSLTPYAEVLMAPGWLEVHAVVLRVDLVPTLITAELASVCGQSWVGRNLVANRLLDSLLGGSAGFENTQPAVSLYGGTDAPDVISDTVVFD